MDPRLNAKCHNLNDVSRVNEIRYLGIHLTQFRLFKCVLDHAKRAFIDHPMP